MKATAVVHLPFTSKNQLTALISALLPEVESQITARSKVVLSTNAQCMVLTIEAEDIVALRAALNAYLRWINSTLNVLGALT